MSQVELSALSGVSLPFIQLIEAGRANPSIKVIEKLLSIFGLVLKVAEVEPNWNDLALAGVPLGHSEGLVWKGGESALMIMRAWIYVEKNPGMTRERDALSAYLSAFKAHYPKAYQKFFGDLPIPSVIDGRQIKLRRIALSSLARIL